MHLLPQENSVDGLNSSFLVLAVTTETPWQCSTCNGYFSSQNNLDHHKIIHLPETVSCHGCPRKFRRYADMLIHLEAGTCTSGTSLQSLNRLAALCFQWKKYIRKEFRQQLLERDGGYRLRGEEPFVCPTCAERFPLLSSLGLHVWSKSCGQGMNSGAMNKLKRWLGKKLYPFKAGRFEA